jgi:hypothetical protein
MLFDVIFGLRQVSVTAKDDVQLLRPVAPDEMTCAPPAAEPCPAWPNPPSA